MGRRSDERSIELAVRAERRYRGPYTLAVARLSLTGTLASPLCRFPDVKPEGSKKLILRDGTVGTLHHRFSIAIFELEPGSIPGTANWVIFPESLGTYPGFRITPGWYLGFGFQGRGIVGTSTYLQGCLRSAMFESLCMVLGLAREHIRVFGRILSLEERDRALSACRFFTGRRGEA